MNKLLNNTFEIISLNKLVKEKRADLSKLKLQIKKSKEQLSQLEDKNSDNKMINAVNYLLRPRFDYCLSSLLREFIDLLPYKLNTEYLKNIIKSNEKYR